MSCARLFRRQVPFIECQVPFPKRQVPFLRRQVNFLRRPVYILKREVTQNNSIRSALISLILSDRSVPGTKIRDAKPDFPVTVLYRGSHEFGMFIKKIGTFHRKAGTFSNKVGTFSKAD